MRKNFGAKPFMYPMPVLIIAAYDESGVANAMNAAWGSVADYKQVAMYLDASHKTVKNILATKAFTVAMATAGQVTACDYVGVVSGNKEPNKMEKAGFHTTKSEFVDAPVITELPMSMDCNFISYDEESGLLLGEIVNVNAEESILTDGKIDPAKLEPITFDAVNNTYIKLGEKVGNAFKDGLRLK